MNEGNVIISRDTFDEDWYLDRYNDVRKSVKIGDLPSGYDHYCLYGKKEGREYSLSEANDAFLITSLSKPFRYEFYRLAIEMKLPSLVKGQEASKYFRENFKRVRLIHVP